MSFHRSKVAELAKRLTKSCGGMLVVGLAEAKILQYTSQVGQHRLSVACFNSPGSSTASGDRDAIEELKLILDKDSVPNRILEVDVAYHSHHMKAVADYYRKLLEGLQASSPREGARFYSSVTGERKITGFGAEYWVQNLISTVRFSDALLAYRRPDIDSEPEIRATDFH